MKIRIRPFAVGTHRLMLSMSTLLMLLLHGRVWRWVLIAVQLLHRVHCRRICVAWYCDVKYPHNPRLPICGPSSMPPDDMTKSDAPVLEGNVWRSFSEFCTCIVVVSKRVSRSRSYVCISSSSTCTGIDVGGVDTSRWVSAYVCWVSSLMRRTRSVSWIPCACSA